MSTFQPFVALGAGNGFAECLTSLTNPTPDGVSTGYLTNISLTEAMKQYWLFETWASNFDVTINNDEGGNVVFNTSFGSVTTEPKNRTCLTTILVGCTDSQTGAYSPPLTPGSVIGETDIGFVDTPESGFDLSIGLKIYADGANAGKYVVEISASGEYDYQAFPPEYEWDGSSWVLTSTGAAGGPIDFDFAGGAKTFSTSAGSFTADVNSSGVVSLSFTTLTAGYFTLA